MFIDPFLPRCVVLPCISLLGIHLHFYCVTWSKWSPRTGSSPMASGSQPSSHSNHTRSAVLACPLSVVGLGAWLRAPRQNSICTCVIGCCFITRSAGCGFLDNASVSLEAAPSPPIANPWRKMHAANYGSDCTYAIPVSLGRCGIDVGV